MLKGRTGFLLTRLVALAIVVAVENADPQTAADYQRIEGFWEGEFMPGNNLTLVLTFLARNDGTATGRVLLFQGEVQIQDDALSEIVLERDRFSFYIEAKSTLFKGRIEPDGLHIAGDLQFPDGSLHPVRVKKVPRPSLGNFADLQEDKRESNSPEKRYSVAQLQNDLKFLRRQLEQTHPQLYLYTSRESFDRLFASTFKSIENEMTEDEFFRMIAPVVAKVRCSHTGIRFSDEFAAAMNNRRSLIPVDINFVNEKAFVITDYAQNSMIEPGMRVLSINGTPASDIWDRLISSIPSDGFNVTHKIYEINANFPYVYSLYLGNSEQFDLECLTSTGKEVRVELAGQSARMLEESMRSAHPERYPTATFPITLRTISETRTAILSVMGFWAPDPEQYNDVLKDLFTKMEVEGIQHLIVDVRGNKGGHPFYAAELLSYLATSDFVYFELPEEKGEFAPLYEPVRCKDEAFKGDIFVLINGGCLSSTGHFLSLVKFHKIATLIGEESGGSFYCNDGSIQRTLPETGIKLNLPQTTFQTAVSGFEKGDPLLPDYHVKPTLEDILNGRDAQLEYALQLIKMGTR